MNNYAVKVIESKSGEVVKVILCDSINKADKVGDGVNINLNHDKYHTETCEVASNE
jgi:hypothetical protein